MTSTPDTFIAIDLGSSSGRTMLARPRDARLDLREVHRFAHRASLRDGRLQWDWAHILRSIREGLAVAAEQAGPAGIASVSCDSWAQDFGLLDGAGELLRSPVSYRDARTRGLPEAFAAIISPDDLVRRTGSLSSPITTLCQLRAMAQTELGVLRRARQLLHVADLVHADLCGVRTTDCTMASASQMVSLATGDWDRELLAVLGVPDHFLPPVVREPTAIGHITRDRAPHPRLAGVPVVISASHDTSAAAACLPTLSEGASFLMSGTWSMLGCASDALIVPGAPAEQGLAILGLAGQRWGLFRPVMGLWIIQECRRVWTMSGLADDFAGIAAVAGGVAAPGAIIDPDDPRFLAPLDMPAEIAAYCAATGQRVPQTPAEVARVVFASLALAYRHGIEVLRDSAGAEFRLLRVVGGGSENALLCQMTADAIGLPVVAGPTEATALGNALLQAQALGAPAPGESLAAVAERSFAPVTYDPAVAPDDELYARFLALKRRAEPPGDRR